MELLIAVDIMRSDKEGVHSDCDCKCDMVCGGSVNNWSIKMCSVHLKVYQRLTNLWESILCEKEDMCMWHKWDCLMGNCIDCGIELLRVCPLELASEKKIKWKTIRYKVVGTTDEGHPRKAATLEYRESVPHEFYDHLKSKMMSFVLYNFVASWQDFQFRELFTSVPPNTLISCVDFSENYTLKIQNEI
jgi:hypothetical protein